MRRRGDLTIPLRAARQLAASCRQAADLADQARGSGQAIEQAARQMHSDLQRSKHAIEDELVAWVQDCERCGRRVHWVVGEGCALGHWSHAEPAPKDHRPRITGSRS
jgi:hypothetical protein